MASSLTLPFASVRGALTRHGGFAARTSSAVRTSARGFVAAAGAPDVSPDAYVVTYCHVRADALLVPTRSSSRRARARQTRFPTDILPRFPPLFQN
jgi:hypothetical protein